MPTPEIPQDMRDLLIRLDQKVADGFQNLNQRLDSMERSQTGLENRVRQIETELSDRSGYKDRFHAVEDRVAAHEVRLNGYDTTARFAKWAAGAIGAAFMFALSLVLKLFGVNV